MKIKIFLLIAFFSASIQCFGKESWLSGCIIKYNGDTIFGLIQDRSSRNLSQKCYFKTSETDSTQILTPEQIQGYRFNTGEMFVAKNIAENEIVFLEFLVQGKMNIYHYRDSYSEDHYFAEKDSELYALKNTTINKSGLEKQKKEYIGLLRYLMQEANIEQEIKHTEYEWKPLVKLAQYYHDKVCPEEQCIVYRRKPEPVKITWSVLAGVTYSSVTMQDFSSLEGSPINYALGSSIGVRMNIKNLAAWDNLWLTSGFFMQYMPNYTLEYDYFFSTGWKKITENIDALALKIPIVVNIGFSKQRFCPYIGFGYVNEMLMCYKKEQKTMKGLSPYCAGATGLLGCKYAIKNKQEVFLELNYEIMISLYGSYGTHRLTGSLFSLSAGYTF